MEQLLQLFGSVFCVFKVESRFCVFIREFGWFSKHIF